MGNKLRKIILVNYTEDNPYGLYPKGYKVTASAILLDLLKSKKPYLKTTTSKLVENTKAFELTMIKELGKLTP